MSRVYLTQNRTPSVSPPPSFSNYHHLPIRPPVVPERSTPPTSHPVMGYSAPTSYPRHPVIINAPPPTIRFDSYEDIHRHSRHASDADMYYRHSSGHSRSSSNASHHSRSSSLASSQRSLSPPSTRSASPSSCSSRSSSTSGKSVRFADKNEYSTAPVPAPAVNPDRYVEYVSSRGASYHVSEHRGRQRAGSVREREREYKDTDTLVVEKARRSGREGRMRAYTVNDDLEARRERHW
ncbi:hypothetical protein BZA05DRAFT_477787 [Tricharina praecox]|uniref:uncharacterized protein n=1 Tax=Tricharina praecox TaxID=43433 RepID=UPI002220EB64|nr:uncharacterized protein BZA05DRAFT_477787 [Tricharina praecox]KAI5841593.1 hypothetical protein BZA05DRAFT_477787 [Tricharina praecox]